MRVLLAVLLIVGGLLLAFIVAGIVFAPWTTMMWVLVSPGGVHGIDWLWIVLAVIVDVGFWTGGAWKNRDRIPGSSSQSAA